MAPTIFGGGIVNGVIKKVTTYDNFIMDAEFSDGTVKRYDVKQLFDEIEVFSEMKNNPDLFKNITIEAVGYGVAWSDSLDLASEEIWDNGITV